MFYTLVCCFRKIAPRSSFSLFSWLQPACLPRFRHPLSSERICAGELQVGSGSDGLLLSPVSPVDVFQRVVLGCGCEQNLLDSLLSQPNTSGHTCDFYLVISGPFKFHQNVKPTSIQMIDEQYDPDITQVYVVDTLHSPEVLKTDNLRIFYRSPTTDLVLAAKPALAESAKNCCP